VHIVTKILMVFCAILSLLLAALTMAFAANASAIRASVAHEQQLRVAAQTEKGLSDAALGQARETYRSKLAATESQLKSLNEQVAQLQAERTRLNSDLQRATSDASSIRGQIAQQAATIETQTQLIKNYRDEVLSLRDANLTNERRAIELTDRVNELEGIREVLDQNVRALKEQLEEARLNMQSAQASGGSVGGAGGANASGVSTMAARSAPREMSGPVVRARITEVFPSPAGDTMVVIDEGANRGIREGTLMNVTRGDQWLGALVITTVEPTRAVGKMQGATTGAPSRDDLVLSRLQ
jgi:TolA-binding protein